MRLEQRESQRLQALAGNLGLQPWGKPTVRRVVMICAETLLQHLVNLKESKNPLKQYFSLSKSMIVKINEYEKKVQS